MVAKTTCDSSTTATSKQRSSLQHLSASSFGASGSNSPKPSPVASSLHTSAKKSLKTAKAKAKAKKNGTNKFRDSEKRELLDGQTSQLFASNNDNKEDRRDPFSYGASSIADKRSTRRQVDEATLALNLLMKS
ncbi:uncharacterized protein UMAG_01065 [Mycosarcoma maydis]|uniref:Uncharacterized protein n=1 Tax=Mycosarcoma maydis TaxID=5270 RepID=A0A0D1E9T8_MYCMD|nr:uncharacterized protein UMAG_01065 [Ustilago maydis 521]KIS71155.1 hypothetical protein UMAG_01065 [Ustilago maydis 521]|eukprot:XP_011387031.1 hypothetical protein UMAG_01065 [Ustilago maydis 521]